MTDASSEPFSWRRDYRHDDSALQFSRRELPAVVADLQDIALAAHLVDRSVRRGRPDRGEDRLGSYRRQLRLPVGLRRLDFWSRSEIALALGQLLTWLTDDTWQPAFTGKPAAHPRGAPLFNMEPPDDIALFSGGLDAVAGTAHALSMGARLDGVSVETNAAMRRYQSRTALALQRVSQGRFRRLPVSLQRIAPPSREEPTRRTRGLVFLVAGFTAAVAAGRQRLLVFENGVGAINLPYVEGQQGSMTSRAVHPKTLALAQHLFSLVLDYPFAVVNPCLHLTKGQMLARLGPSWADACGLSESCDLAAAGRRNRRCGGCTSCLLRRMSFVGSGRQQWDPRPYTVDVISALDGSTRLPEMLWQAHRLQSALLFTDPVLGLRRAFPQVGDVEAVGALSGTGLVRLYSAYVEEWRRFPHPAVPAFLAPLPAERLSA